MTGSAKPIAAGAQYLKQRAFINGGVSPRGTLVYQTVTAPARYKLAWMDRKGERTPVPVEPLEINTLYPSARLSKDARRVAVLVTGSRSESSAVIVDLERGIRTLIGDPTLTFTYGGLWGPGEQSVIVNETLEGVQHLVRCPVGGGPGTTLMDGESGFEYE